ncbi:hypothetical protein TPHA_0H02870 [Tetrapisispora phaffii CBS 4417]|uniref:Tubulin-folding cofactor D ARM repeats domain-containing protein n=1 Tax=Tetrapisispora phaffii (strain ATCC 24235 / CBS 4417 / NBRC 1672 / NRRL Y-8282 / UCD 70-5) TaxID=1071381 RepID=G8BWN9_TETPH|nr:hypothetical protein TPHA_0H02870 [Tetrapisispora phaffii CBS 4417]CCE64490.1 hypothetical protein TPHA_0H02870 [Tetrapisispora phaffii CBS 4417]
MTTDESKQLSDFIGLSSGLDTEELLDALQEYCSRDNIIQKESDIIKIINKFENDPSLLTRHLSTIIKSLVELVLPSGVDADGDSLDLIVTIGNVYYELYKIVSTRNLGNYLPTEISNLAEIINLYQINRENLITGHVPYSWKLDFFLLSWLNVLVESPFRFTNDKVILALMMQDGFHESESILRFDIINLKSKVTANLIIKNIDLFDKSLLIGNFTLLDFFLKKLIILPTNKILSLISAFKNDIIDLTIFLLNLQVDNENELNRRKLLKIFSKLFKLNYYLNNGELLIRIIKKFERIMFDLKLLNSGDFRYTLSNKYSNVIHFLNYEIKNTKMVNQIINGKINKTVKMLDSLELIDTDILHLTLLFIADNISIILTNNIVDIDFLFSKIFIKTINFQKLEINNNNTIIVGGNNIKDATNFILWSILRSNSKIITKKTIDLIFIHLLTSSLYDNELIIRKSSNAALQELLGRFNKHLDLDSSRIMRIIELPITNLNVNYEENTVKLYKNIFDEDISRHYWYKILEWMVSFNISKKIKILKTFLLNLNLINNFISLSNYNNTYEKNIYHRIIQEKHNYDLERLLFLLINYYSKLEHNTTHKENLLTQINKIFHDLSDTLELKKYSANSPFISFRVLSILEYFKFMIELTLSNINNSSSYPISFQLKMDDISLIIKILQTINDSSMFFDDIKLKVNYIVSKIEKGSQIYKDTETEEYFWSNFEKLLFYNNAFASFSLPYLHYKYFLQLFLKCLQKLNCNSKSIILHSLTPLFSERYFELNTISDQILLKRIIINLLNDYTITEQGDIGRLVRTSSIKLIECNFSLFFEHADSNEAGELQKTLISNCLRLLGEPQLEIKQLAFKVLKKKFGYTKETTNSIDFDILLFQHKQFEGKSRAFWEGFLMTSGAIHTTDIQLKSSVDSFIYYYSTYLETGNRKKGITKLELCNELFRIIPNASKIIESKKESCVDPLTGSVGQDILKITTSYLYFWSRVLESSLEIPREFNYAGAYGKLYNLQILKGSSLLKSITIKILPYFVISHSSHFGTDLSNSFTKTVILRLLKLINREIMIKKDSHINGSPTYRASVEGLAKIYIYFNNFSKLSLLEQITNDVGKFNKLEEKEFL